MGEPQVTITLTLPLREARSLLGWLGGENVLVRETAPQESQATARTLRAEDVALLMRGEKPSLVVKTFAERGGGLLNENLAGALGLKRPQLTFKPLATITLRLRKIGVPERGWYKRERVDGKTFLRLRPDVANLFEQAIQFTKESQRSKNL